MSDSKTSIVFSGDIGFDRYMDRKWEDRDLLSREVMDFIHSADHACVNVEGALVNAEDDGSKGIFFHNMDPAAACVLQAMKADIWCIGNNHSMDAGKKGLASTLSIAQSMGCRTIGAGLNEEESSRPVFLEEAGGIGLISVAYMPTCIPATADQPGNFRWDNMDYIARRIAEIKESCRWCVVVVHGGEEFTCLPSPYTRDRYLKYLAMGADVVIGHHPHVPENYELFEDGKAIFYSLGNFIFDTDYQRAHLYTDIGILLKLTFTEERFDFEAVGVQLTRGEERLDIAPLPHVFTDVSAEEYRLLYPLAARAFVAEEKRRMIFMKPEQYANASGEDWAKYFFSTDRNSYIEGENMDFSIILPLAEAAEKEDWKQSRLEAVRQYIMTLL